MSLREVSSVIARLVKEHQDCVNTDIDMKAKLRRIASQEVCFLKFVSFFHFNYGED